jgi:endonuclease/exonuclease/phosphatase (EEP) superfamily protein YafD
VTRVLFWFAFMGRTFSPHLGLLLLAFVLIAALFRRRRIALASFALAGVLLFPWAASFLRAAPSRSGAPTLIVMSANLLRGSVGEESLLAEIRRTNPDVILFQEYTPDKAAALRPVLGPLYPHYDEAMRDHAFGQAIFSRFAFVSPADHAPHAALRESLAGALRLGGVVGIQDPQIRVAIDFHGTPVVLHNIHMPPPMGGSYLAEQRRMTAWLCDSAAAETRPLILAGDFNSTPESLNAADLRAAGLFEASDTAKGRSTTWPTEGPLSWIPGVRIDHQWHNVGLVCVRSEVCADNPSDHRPIVATYELRSPR